MMFNGSKASEPLTNGRGRQCMKSFGGQNRGSSEPLTIGLPTKKSKVLRFQICFTRTKYLSETYKNQSIKVGAAKLFSVNSSCI